MKSPSDNTPLDIFIKEVLCAPDTNLQPIDWSEIEVLLRHEKKSISIGADKKTITYSVVGAIALIVIFSIVKIVQHYSSLPSEPGAMQDSTQNSFNTVDTVSAILPSPVLQTDTLKIDSSTVVKNQSQIDSSGITKSNKKTDSGLAVSPLMPDSAWIRRIHEKQDKKRKQAAKDSATIKNVIVQPIIHSDTTLFSPAPPEIKIKQTAPPIDTVTKSGAPKNNAKGKKQKKSATPVEIKSDSLK